MKNLTNSQAISIILPNYNGLKLLKANLKSLLGYFKNHPHELIFIDNNSSDGSADYVKENFEKAKIIKLDTNYGYGYACNKGVKSSQYPYIFITNNDVRAEEDFLPFLLESLESEDDIFAVSCLQKIITKNKTFYGGMARPIYKFGMIKHDNLKVESLPDISPIFYPAGAGCLIDKKKFEKLGGFLDIYAPFYWEDTDLGLRAWQYGWKSLVDKRAKIIHYHESTSAMLNPYFVRLVANRNKLLFNWNNLTGTKEIFSHIIFLSANLFNMWLKDWLMPLSFLWALLFLPKILFLRLSRRKYRRLNNQQIFNYWGDK